MKLLSDGIVQPTAAGEGRISTIEEGNGLRGRAGRRA